MIISIDLPEEIKKDISIATAILMSEGCKEVYIFGSLVEGAFSDSSDIDLAIIGLEKKKYFKVYSVSKRINGHCPLIRRSSSKDCYTHE